MTLRNRTYNVIKWLITIGLPATGALYWGLVQVWDFPRIAGVNGTINLVCVFLGTLINYSGRQYAKLQEVARIAKRDADSDGDLIINEVDGDLHPALGVKGSLEALMVKDEVKLTVVNKSDTDPRMLIPEK